MNDVREHAVERGVRIGEHRHIAFAEAGPRQKRVEVLRVRHAPVGGVAVVCACCIFPLTRSIARAQAPAATQPAAAVYTTTSPSPDGTGKVFGNMPVRTTSGASANIIN